jgi:glycolate oxidase iron-sulfur subunit
MMTSVEDLARLMREIEEQLVVCMRCGMCQAVCPLFEQTGREADVARGKLSLLDGLLQEMFQNPGEVQERLNKCLLCGSCAANCPSGVQVLEIFIKARAILTGYLGLSSAKRLVLRKMLAHPALFDRLAAWGAKFQQLLTKPANDILGTSCARISSPLLADRHFLPLAATPFHRKTPELDTQAGSSGLKVAFYVGCLIDKIFPQIAQATIEVLNYHGVGIYLPPHQGCCGIPAVSAGDTKAFGDLLLHNLEKFNPDQFDYLVTACGTCTSTIREVWPLLVPDHAAEITSCVRALASKTLDINQFLVAKVGVNALGQPRADNSSIVTYHDPCHLKKGLGVAAEPRKLIDSHPNMQLREMTESDWCCGLGGSFNLQYYDISSRIGQKKRTNITATGCSTVATGCPACMLQIADMLSQSAQSIRIRHPIEIYADAIRAVA